MMTPSCPSCDGPLVEVFQTGRIRVWLCPVAIGVQEYDHYRRLHTSPSGDVHGYVRAWTDAELRARGVGWTESEETSRAVDYSAQRRERVRAA